MTLRIKLSHLVVALVAGAVLVGAGYALATTRSSVIHACVNSRTRALTVPASGRCARGSKALSWNSQGPRGAKGAKGARGPGGASGTSASVSIGSVTTQAAGSQATVTNSGSGGNAVLNFGIPQGAAGQNGTNATNSGPTAYGEVWMGSDSAEIASNSGGNVLNVSGGGGSATVRVDNCLAATPTEPIIVVTPDADSADPLANANNTANVVGAYVTSYGDDNSPGDHIADFTVETFNPIATSDTSVNSDFSFVVYC